MTASRAARAVVLDMDGTMVDNVAYHTRAWLELARSLGTSHEAELFEREMAGRKNEEILPVVLGRPLSDEEIAKLAREKEERYRALYAPHVAPLAGLDTFLARLRDAGVKCAVASSAPAENRAFVLDSLGLRGAFACIVGAEDVARGKPHPDIFLAAARGLDVPAESCVVFEDASNGIRAARAAGMRAAGVTTTHPAEELLEAGAEWTMPSFEVLPASLEAFVFDV